MTKPALLVLFVCACGGSEEPTSDSSVAPSLVDASMFDGDTLYAPAGYTPSSFLSDAPVRTFSAAGVGAETGKHYEVVLVTDVGRLVLDLSEADAPIAVNSMVWLARHHFYDGIAFHRVIDDFVAQGGDPNTLQSDSSTWGDGDAGYSFATEVATGRKFDGAGVLGMARSDSLDSNGSQFFITFSAQPSLDGLYTVFGTLVEGADVLPQIVRGEPPANPTRITYGYAVEKAD